MGSSGHNILRVFLIGDVFGRPGRQAITQALPELIDSEKLDLVIANGENMAGGRGMTPETCQELFHAGVNIITSGNHARDKKEIDEMLKDDSRLLRPLNYPSSMPGKGYTLAKGRSGWEYAVINSMGRVHIGEIDSPFQMTKQRVDEMKAITPRVIVDFHAEATSEKRAMGWYLDGSVSAVLGTHSHVQTADEEILPNGTAYMTDVGMTGPYDSVIGLRKDLAFERFLENKRAKFDVGKGDVRLCGAMVDIDAETGKAVTILRFRKDMKNL